MDEEYILELSDKITYATQNEDCVIIQYQPIHNNHTEKIEKFEVLMRLEIDGEILYPNDFLPIAKQIGKYKDLSKIAIEKAFRYFSTTNLEFTINLSIIDISDVEFQKYFFKKLNQYNINNRLTIEIVESEKIEKDQIFCNFIKKLKLLDCKIAVDDFGIGYGNLEYILSMSEQIDYIKFDGCLVQNILTSEKVQSFIGNLMRLCEDMKVSTIAEFVETQEVMHYLESIGVDYSQGYHIGMPQSCVLNIRQE